MTPRARIAAAIPAIGGLLALALLLLGFAVIGRLDRDYSAEQHDRAQSRAEILSASVSAALDFGDRGAARELVSALLVSRDVSVAAVYNARGALFVGYARPGEPLPPRLTRSPPGDLYALGEAPVVRAGQRIGTVSIRSELEPASRRIGRYALITLFTGFASLTVAVLARAQQQLRVANAGLAAANAQLLQQIVEREKAEAQLRQVQKMESIGQLTGGIAHDFNNMLSIVIGNLDIAQRRFATHPDSVLGAIRHALEGANRAATLTRRLLAFARRQPLQSQRVEAAALVEAMSELLRRTLGEGIVIETRSAAGLWPIRADPGELENAILNLCVNARDAMRGAGRLTIATANVTLDEAAAGADALPGDYVAVSVADTGPGMPREVVERAFEPFFTTKETGKGTGLGLSQVYGFCRQSGGHVKIDSTIGEGTTVSLFLPRDDAAPEVARPADRGSLPRASAGDVVLVVEDESQVRRISAESLRELGYVVVEAADGRSALAALAANPCVRLLFTDVVMPGMNGRELADRALQVRPDLVVVFATGYSGDAIVHNGTVDAGVRLLQKPFTLDQLAHKMRAALDDARA